MPLPDLPPEWEEGYDWIERLSGGWYVVPSWGSDGWDLGSWPYVIVTHCNADTEADIPWGMATYVEGDITVRSFQSREERNRATDEVAVFYWSRDDDLKTAPKTLDDSRLGPYRQKPRAPGNRPGVVSLPGEVDPNLYYPARQHAFTWALAQGHDYETVTSYADYYARFEVEYEEEYYPAHSHAFERFQEWLKSEKGKE